LRSGGREFSKFESWLHPESLSALFCSEMCAAAWKKVGLLKTENASKWSPNFLCRAALDTTICSTPRRWYPME
jgi:hypothetical protein